MGGTKEVAATIFAFTAVVALAILSGSLVGGVQAANGTRTSGATSSVRWHAPSRIDVVRDRLKRSEAAPSPRTPKTSRWRRSAFAGGIAVRRNAWRAAVVRPRRLARAGEAQFATLPPDSALPSGAECASSVRRHGWEPRPQNAQFNQTRGRPLQVAVASYQPEERVNRLLRRVDGQFTGTTDEILQWGACKWGIDVDVVRAIATTESWWNHRDTKGDAGHSVGLMQVKCAYEGDPHRRAWPHCLTSTAFNVDYGLAYVRNAFEGNFGFWWPSNASWQAVKGDLWMAIGAYYLPGDRTAMATYAAKVRAHSQKKPWSTDRTFYDGYVKAGPWPGRAANRD